MTITVRKINKTEWNEVGHAVHLMVLPYHYSEIEKKINISFDSGSVSGDESFFCFLDIGGKKVFLEWRDYPEDHNVLVSILSYEIEWDKIKNILLNMFSIEMKDLLWVQQELKPAQYVVETKSQLGATDGKFYFPNERLANASLNYFKINQIEVIDVRKVHRK